MKHHKYFNTIWTERDQEFYWDGCKNGFVFGTILTVSLIVDGITFIKWIENEFKTKKKS